MKLAQLAVKASRTNLKFFVIRQLKTDFFPGFCTKLQNFEPS